MIGHQYTHRMLFGIALQNLAIARITVFTDQHAGRIHTCTLKCSGMGVAWVGKVGADRQCNVLRSDSQQRSTITW